MEPIHIAKKIEVKPSSIHGYGVFAKKKLKAGEIVEECLSINDEMNPEAYSNYIFDRQGGSALLTGYGVIYNHSVQPNVDFRWCDGRIMVFKALKTIYPGQELLVNYGRNWFVNRNLQEISVPIKWRLLHNPLVDTFSKGVTVIGGLYGIMFLLQHYLDTFKHFLFHF